MSDTFGTMGGSRLTRRRFVKVAGGGALGGATLSGGFLASLGRPLRAVATNASVLCTMVCEQGATFTRNFNPFSATARWAATKCMYEPLMVYNYAASKLEPWLATTSTWGAGNTTLSMQLRSGAVWSDGQPFTAADVVYTFELMRDNPGLIGSASGAWNDYLAAVKAPDDHTVEFQFKRAYAPGLYLVANQFIVPQHIWKSAGDPVKFTNPDPVSTGPFTELAPFRPQVYEVHRNPKYWGQITIDGLRLPAFSGNDQISAAVISGEIDWGGLVANPDKTFVAKDPKHNHYWWPTTTDVCLYLNTTKKPFDDPQFRKAIGPALDRKRMIATAIWGKSSPANPTGLAEYAYKDWIDQGLVASGAEWVTYDPAKANQLLDAAGYKRSGGTRTTPDGQALKFTTMVPGAWTDWVADNQVIVNNLQAVGIEVELKTISADNWTTNVYTGDFDMSLFSGTQGATPFDFYRGTMSSSTYVPIGQEASENVHRYKNADADALLTKFAATEDPAQQKALVKQLEALFVQEAPVIPLYGQPDWGLFTTKRITGFPDAENPYAPLTNLGIWPSTLLVFPHLKPA